MYDIIEIGFKGGRRDYFSNPQEFPFKVGDYAIVEADRGEDLGKVVQVGELIRLKKPQGELKKIIRKPGPEDLRRLEENKIKEKEAFQLCKEKIAKHGLTMKLVDVEFQFDRNKITFYFTAEKRVDFRELVKDLAAEYKTRIELRQIGVRDEARRIGGCGICGRPLCCTTFLKEFEPITTLCAKEQNLPLNPSKLSGVCGRLMCCLLYERDYYRKVKEKFPPVNTEIKTSRGIGIVEKIDIFKEEVYLKFGEYESEKFSLKELSQIWQR